MIKYLEPATIDPRELKPGDQVGFSTGGTGFMVMLGEPHEDEVWLTLVNEPDKTTDIPHHSWTRPLPGGNVALNLADHGWVWGVYPMVWARKRIT